MGDVARAGGGEFVGVDEETSIGIARVDGHHAVVDVFLGALAVVTGGEETASGVGGEAGLEAGGLGVVVVAVAVLFRDVLEDDAPVAFKWPVFVQIPLDPESFLVEFVQSLATLYLRR